MIETIISNFHLEKFLWIIKKRFFLIVLFTALGGILGAAYAQMTSSTYYRAAISFYVYSNPEYKYDASVNISSSEFTLAKNLVKSYALVLKSNTVLEKVIESTELSYAPEELAGMISHSSVDDTAIFYVYVYNSNPYHAMELVNSIADIAPAEIGRIVKTGGIEVIDYAKLPTSPYASTSVIKYTLYGAIGVGGLFFLLFIFIGLLDTTIRRRYELRLSFRIPILGDVPWITSLNKKVKTSPVLEEESPFALKESYNKVRTNVIFTGKGEKCPIYAVTSAEQNEGKTLNSVNLAIGYSQLGKKTLLIDGDMRNASVAAYINETGETGLSEYLAGMVSEAEITNPRENLYLLNAGALPPNPAELLAGEYMKELLHQAQNEYDCVIIDLPPAGIVTDALLLAKNVVGYIVIVRAGVSRMNRLKNLVSLLEQVDGCICGFVFNGMNPKSQDYNYRKLDYYYSYGQSENEKKKKGKKSGKKH
ncbi:polysaccharide biosynthesis tyrosine autokinase [Lachnospiraceae bacterium OttesenSCG-928-D06]|nr:polysaccharide biosynthesis tyrosine autokinase [Lachnospiraceae bacterium OttesenSCG-928-D06]